MQYDSRPQSGQKRFKVHGVNELGNVVLLEHLRRDQVAALFANLPVCLVGMEAGSSANHWARKLGPMGHTARLVAPAVRRAVRQEQQERRG